MITMPTEVSQVEMLVSVVVIWVGGPACARAAEVQAAARIEATSQTLHGFICMPSLECHGFTAKIPIWAPHLNCPLLRNHAHHPRHVPVVHAPVQVPRVVTRQ